MTGPSRPVHTGQPAQPLPDTSAVDALGEPTTQPTTPQQPTEPILTVHRSHPDATQTVHTLLAGGGRYAVAGGTGTLRALPGARSAVDALHRSSLLHTAHAAHSTAYTIRAAEALRPNQVLDAIRPIGDPEVEYRHPAWEDDEAEDEGDWFDDATVVWSTRHRISLNGRPVYAAPTPSYPLVVPADDYDAPYESWTDLLTLSWDSSTYAGVGLAGFGSDGVYLVRPGVLALVSATDESLEVSIQRVSPRASVSTLVNRFLDSGLAGNRIWPHLVLAAYGYSAGDLMPEDSLTCRLSRADVRRVLAARRWVQR